METRIYHPWSLRLPLRSEISGLRGTITTLTRELKTQKVTLTCMRDEHARPSRL